MEPAVKEAGLTERLEGLLQLAGQSLGGWAVAPAAGGALPAY